MRRRNAESVQEVPVTDIDHEIREQLGVYYDHCADPMVLADPVWEAKFSTPNPDTGQSLYGELAQQRMRDPRYRKLSYDEQVAEVQAIDRNERSLRAVAHATKLAKQGQLKSDMAIQLAGRLQPSHNKREELADNSLSEYVSSLRGDPYETTPQKREVREQLGWVHKAVDRQPIPERQQIRRAADLLAKGDQQLGDPLSKHDISALQAAMPRFMGQRNPGSRHDRTRQELIEIVKGRQSLPNTTLRGRHDLDGILASLNSDPTTPVERYAASAPPRQEYTEPGRGRKLVASVTAVSIGSGLASLAIASPAAAAPHMAPAADTTPLDKAPQPAAPDVSVMPASSTSSETNPAAPPPTGGLTLSVVSRAAPNFPNLRNITVPVKPPEVEPLAPLQLPKVVPLLPLAPPAPLPASQMPRTTADTAPSNIVAIGSMSAPEPAPSQSPNRITPLAPGTKVVQITLPRNINSPSASSADTITNPAALTPIADQTQVVAVSASGLGTPNTSSALTAASAEQAPPATDAMTVYQQMVQQGASLNDRVYQLSTALQSQGYTQAPFQNTEAAVLNQAALLENAALANSSLSSAQLQQIRQQLDTAAVLVLFPSYQQQANAGSLIDTKDAIFVNADAKDIYQNPATYGNDPALLTEMSQLDPTVSSTISQLLASADALNRTPQQQVNALANIDPTAAARLTSQLTKLAVTPPAPAAPATPTPPKVAKPAPQPPKHNAAPAPETTSTPQAEIKRLVKFGVPETYAKLYVKYGNMYGHVTPEFLAAQGKWESGYNRTAVSPAGAQGISQFMPGTWSDWAKKLNFPSGASPFNPEYAIHAQAAMMSSLVGASKQYASSWQDAEAIALAGYNLGFGTVQQYHGMPPKSLIGNYATGIEAIKSNILSTPLSRFIQKVTRPSAGKRLATAAVGRLTQPAGGPFEYTERVPKGGEGHDAYYSNQIADDLPGINGENACMVYSVGSIYASEKQMPTTQAIYKAHTALEQGGAYSDGSGGIDSRKMLNIIQNQLGLNVRIIQFERQSPTLSDGDMAQIRKALEQNDKGTPTMILLHTSKRVSEILGNQQGNLTDGHFLYMFAYKGSNGNYKYYVGNPGNRIDTPPKGHGFTQSEIENWLDGAYVISA